MEYSLDVMEGVRWFLARIALVPPNGDGQPTFSFLARDITPLKEMEQALLESNKKFSGLFDNAATGMAIVGLDGHCIEVNACLSEILGYSPEELHHLPFGHYSHPEDLPEDLEQFERLVRGEMNSYRMEKRFIRKNGEVVWGYLTVALQRNADGAPLYTIAVVENITQRKKIEAEKSRLLGELEAIFASAAEGIIFHDNKGRILRINPAAEEITGLSEEHRGLSLQEIFAQITPRRPEGTPLPLEEWAIYRAVLGTPQRGEITKFQGRDGSEVWISLSASPIFDASGQQVGTVSTFADITRQHEYHNRLENYIHILGHELRNPLTVISGHSQILQEGLQKTATEEFLLSARAILRASDQMREMMEDLVKVGRMDSGEITLRHDRIELREFLGDFFGRHGVCEEYRRVWIKVPESMPAVRIGIHHLERILGNVIGNALKYSETDQPVDVEVTHKGAQVCVAVQDYGRGIDREDLPHIFERFYRSQRVKKRAGGTGLGLYITRGLIEAYGGSIDVESEPNEGARFTICLPAIVG